MAKRPVVNKWMSKVDRFAGLESPWAIVPVVLVSATLLVLRLPTFPVGGLHDDGTYITMARSILVGKGLSVVYLPGDPVYPFVPVGYPLLLVPLVALFPGSFLPLKLLSVVFTLLAVVLLYRCVRQMLDRRVALMVTLLFGTSPVVIAYGTQVMSEAAFIFFTIGACLQAERFVERPTVRWYEILVTGLVVSLPLDVRYLGLPVVIALTGYIIFRRRDWAAVEVAGFAVVCLLTLSLAVGGQAVVSYYLDKITQLLAGWTSSSAPRSSAELSWRPVPGWFHNVYFILRYSIPTNLVALFDGPRVQGLFDRINLSWMPALAQFGIDAVLGVGFVHQLRERRGAVEWAVLVYAATLFALPTDWTALASRFRYWVPLIPFAYMYLLVGVRTIGRFVFSWLRPLGWCPPPAAAALIVSALLATLNLGRNAQESLVNPLTSRIPDLSAGRAWIRHHTSEDDLIMVRWPRVEALYLDRELVPYPAKGDIEQHLLYRDINEWRKDRFSEQTLCQIIDAFNVDYILIQPALVPDVSIHWRAYVRNQMLPMIQANGGKFTLAWSSEDGFTRVYEVREGGPCGAR